VQPTFVVIQPPGGFSMVSVLLLGPIFDGFTHTGKASVRFFPKLLHFTSQPFFGLTDSCSDELLEILNEFCVCHYNFDCTTNVPLTSVAESTTLTFTRMHLGIITRRTYRNFLLELAGYS